MATIRSLTESFGVLKRNPIAFVGGLLFAIILLPQSVLSLLGIPLVPQIIQILTFFITPFILAGLLGMVYEGRVRSTDLGTFMRIGKAKYVSILAGNLLNALITLVFGIVSFVAFIFTIGLSLSAAQSEAAFRSVGIAAIGIFGGLVLVYLIVMFFLQFYAAAIVVDNVGVIKGYQRSVGLVRRNIIQTLGYGVLNLLFSVLLLLPAFLLLVVAVLGAGAVESAAATEAGTVSASSSGGGASGSGGFGLVFMAGIIGYSFLTTVLMKPLRTAFAVSFYDNHKPSNWG